MDSLSPDDINALVDFIGISLVVVCFCFGWLAGGFR